MNYTALKEMIENRHINITSLARSLGMSRVTLGHKLNGYSDFKLTEIRGITKELRLTEAERDHIFFEQ